MFKVGDWVRVVTENLEFWKSNPKLIIRIGKDLIVTENTVQFRTGIDKLEEVKR